MLDMKRLREDSEGVKSAMAARGADVDIDAVLEADAKRRDILGELEMKRAERNSASQSVGEIMRAVGQAKKAGEPTDELLVRADEMKAASTYLGTEIAALEDELRPLEEDLREAALGLPNPPHDSVPVGTGESDNTIVRIWGDPPSFSFESRAHWELGETLDIIDFDRAAKIAGARFALIHSFGMNRPELGLSLVALGAVLGHCFSPYLKLSGGRGVSTSLGALLAIDWRVGLLVFGVWLVVITISRYISFASILAAASSPLVFALYGDSRYYVMLGVVLAIILIERHRPNIGRLLAGSETKIGQKAKPKTDDDDQQQ